MHSCLALRAPLLSDFGLLHFGIQIRASHSPWEPTVWQYRPVLFDIGRTAMILLSSTGDHLDNARRHHPVSIIISYSTHGLPEKPVEALTIDDLNPTNYQSVGADPSFQKPGSYH